MRRVTTACAGLSLLLSAGCQSPGNRDGAEVKVRLDEVPPAAREALTREAAGAPIGEVEREREGGRVVYEAEIRSGGRTREVTVDAEGNVISRGDDGEDAE